jgi:hypothetical protein
MRRSFATYLQWLAYAAAAALVLLAGWQLPLR